MTGRKVANVNKTLVSLRAQGLVYVSGYAERTYQNCIPPREWSLGNKHDVPRPKAKSNKQKKADYRRRNAAIPRVKHFGSYYESLGVWRGLM